MATPSLALAPTARPVVPPASAPVAPVARVAPGGLGGAHVVEGSATRAAAWRRRARRARCAGPARIGHVTTD